MTHYIDALYALARAGMRCRFQRTAKSTHDNPLRKLGRDMAALEAKQSRWSRAYRVVNGQIANPSRREKKALRRELGLTSGRAWRRWLKAANRGERGAFRGVAA